MSDVEPSLPAYESRIRRCFERIEPIIAVCTIQCLYPRLNCCKACNIFHAMQYTYKSRSFRESDVAYQPCFLIFNTRLTAAWKPCLNLLRHLSLCRRFLFVPPRSWNLCLLKSLRT
jgi:hypothetical protein